MALTKVREVSLTITAVAAAAAAIIGLVHYAGLVATVAIASAIAMLLTVLAVQRIVREARDFKATIKVVEYHLAPNGREDALPERLRGLPVRELVSHCIREQQVTNTRLERGDAWMDEHVRMLHPASTGALRTPPRVRGEE